MGSLGQVEENSRVCTSLQRRSVLSSALTEKESRQEAFVLKKTQLKTFTERIKKYNKLMDDIQKAEIDHEIAQMHYLNECLNHEYTEDLKQILKRPDEFKAALDAAWELSVTAKQNVRKAEDDLAQKKKTYNDQVTKVGERQIKEKEEILAARKGMEIS